MDAFSSLFLHWRCHLHTKLRMTKGVWISHSVSKNFPRFSSMVAWFENQLIDSDRYKRFPPLVPAALEGEVSKLTNSDVLCCQVYTYKVTIVFYSIKNSHIFHISYVLITPPKSCQCSSSSSQFIVKPLSSSLRPYCCYKWIGLKSIQKRKKWI